MKRTLKKRARAILESISWINLWKEACSWQGVWWVINCTKKNMMIAFKRRKQLREQVFFLFCYCSVKIKTFIERFKEVYQLYFILSRLCLDIYILITPLEQDLDLEILICPDFPSYFLILEVSVYICCRL